MQPIYIKNTLAKYDVEFLKLDYDNHNIKLKDAVFSLYKYNEETKVYVFVEAGLTTNSQGELKLSNLSKGKYRLLETAVPNGYYLPEDYTIDFEIEWDGSFKDPSKEKIYNQKLASVKLVKRDFEDTRILLKDAVFALYEYNEHTHEYEEVRVNLKTDENGELVVTGLYPGSYKFVETAAPQGYYLDGHPEYLFKVLVDEHKRLIEVPEINATNKQLGKVQIYKVDSDNHELYLEGAEFVLYKYDIEEESYKVYRTDLESDEHGSLLIENLEPGEYKLVETKSPIGYELPENPETMFIIIL
jgi:Predicted outer membrane protein